MQSFLHVPLRHDWVQAVSSFYIGNYIVIILIMTVQNSPAAGDKA